MKLTLVHNPSAGREAHAGEDLVRMLEDEGHEVRYVDLSEANLKKALEKAADLVVVAGGDGTVGKVLRRMSRRRVPVAVLPLGSANNIACVLGHDLSVEGFAKALPRLRPRRFDVGVARGPWGERRFVEAVGLGPLAQALVAGDAAGVPGESSVRFGRAAFRALLDDTEGARIRLELDGERSADELAMVEVLNTGQIGPRLRLAPGADPGDGLLEVVCVPIEDCERMLDWLEDPDRTPPPLRSQRARSVVIRCDRATMVHVDDKFPEVDGPFEVRIELEPDPVLVLTATEREVARVVEPLGSTTP